MTTTVVLPPMPVATPPLEADPVRVAAYGQGLRTSSAIFDDLGSFVAGGARTSGLEGVAHDAYLRGLAPLGLRADTESLGLRDVATLVLDHSDELASLRSRRTDLVDWADHLAGAVAWLRTRAPKVTEPEAAAFAQECRTVAGRVADHAEAVRTWIADVARAEREMSRAFSRLLTPEQVRRRYAGLPDPADTALATRPGDGASASEVRAWWDGLTDVQRAALIAADPEIIGNLDGIPARARDAANRVTLDRDLATLPQIPDDDRTDAETDRLANALAADRARRRMANAIDPVTNEHYVPQLYLYDPDAFGGDGRVAIAVGDLDTADDVAITVPGFGTDGGSAYDQAAKAIDVQQAAAQEGGTSTATMFWIGYDAPDNLPLGEGGFDGLGVTREDLATSGGERLAATIDGLDAMRDHDVHLTVIGHSYGSTTTAHAMTDHHPEADDVVLVGSPGVGGGTTDAGALGVGADHVWVGRNSADPVATWGDDGWVDTYLLGGGGLGRDPAEDDFGAQRFEAESTTRGQGGFFGDHHKYFAHDTESLANIAHVVNGQYAEVTLAGHVHDPLFGPPHDPETDRTPTAPDTDGRP
ncbi:alpha/beta hydrolase [Nocardioides cheoyonin]|uniref:alpha/beta hydrolase n=1 Tax=Nocardioides cheoyonin TaxID=3156615 RepID=UPI0032B56EB4